MKPRKKAKAPTKRQKTELAIDQIQQMKETIAVAASDLKRQMESIVSKTISTSSSI